MRIFLGIFRDSLIHFRENKDKYRFVVQKMMLQGCSSLTFFEKISKEEESLRETRCSKDVPL